MPIVSVLETILCRNTEFTIINSTNESQHLGALTYQWDFDEDGIIDSTDPNPVIAYSESGLKTVTVFSQIPGCESAVEMIELNILEGPTASFFATAACDGDAVSFTNASENAISYQWDFTDGVTSTAESPTHVFSSAGNYFVELVTTDANGCQDTEVVEVAVLDVPEVAFDFGILCTSSEGNLFEDESTVSNSDIISWSWSVDGTQVSTDQNPTLAFSELGLRNITLSVVSANGCESSYSEEVEILPAPIPDFAATINCVGEASLFEDMTLSEGNPVNEWVWDVNGTTYLTEDIAHVFDVPGQYEVTLEVGAQNFCSESITKTIEVLRLPVIDFSIEGNCDNQLITASENVVEFNDPVVSRQWLLDGSVVGNGSEILIDRMEGGNYDLTLQVETENGCITNTTRQIAVNNAPTSAFAFDRYFGIPGDVLTFTNESSEATSFQWLVDGTVSGESSNDQTFTFEEAGNFQVSLVAANDLGCSDTINQEVVIRIPEVDLKIRNFDIIEEENVGRVLVEIENQSNLPIDVTNVQLTLENQFSVTEKVNELIENGDSKLVALNTGIPLALSQPSYFCVEISSQYSDYPDLTPIDNEKCINLEPSIIVEDPFPNPVTAQTRLKIISPLESETVIRVVSSSGKIEMEQVVGVAQGLNNFFIDMSSLNAGIYFILIDIDGSLFRKKLLKL